MALELSYVNSSLQLLKEELEELNCSVDADGPERCVCARTHRGGVRECEGLSRRAASCVSGVVGGGLPGLRGHLCFPQDTHSVQGEGQVVESTTRALVGEQWGGSCGRGHSLRPGSRAGITVPMIPLGLKETTELDWSTALKVS